jgi:hypothetical protein
MQERYKPFSEKADAEAGPVRCVCAEMLALQKCLEFLLEGDFQDRR